MVEEIIKTAIIAVAAPGTLYGIARIVRERYHGKAKLVRAERGDPELPDQRTTLLDVLAKRGG